MGWEAYGTEGILERWHAGYSALTRKTRHLLVFVWEVIGSIGGIVMEVGVGTAGITAGTGTSSSLVGEKGAWWVNGLGGRRLLERVVVGVLRALVGDDVELGNALAAQLDGLNEAMFFAGLEGISAEAELSIKICTSVWIGLVVLEAISVATIDVAGEGVMLPDSHVGELRVIGLHEICIDDAHGEGDGIFTGETRGGTLPVDGA